MTKMLKVRKYATLLLIFCDIIITHSNGSRESTAIIRLCDSACTSVCLSVRTIKPKRLKFKSPNLAQRQSITTLAHHLLLGQQVKTRSYRVKKCKKLRRDSRATPSHCDVTPLNETAPLVSSFCGVNETIVFLKCFM